MKIIRKKKDILNFLEKLKKRALGVDQKIEKIVRSILNDVRVNGDNAVKKYTEMFDAVKLKSLRIDFDEISKYAAMADKQVLTALKKSADRIRSFHEMQREESWTFTENNSTLGQLIRPLERVGIYVPGGKASYPSTVLMNTIPAQVAGVKEIMICVPTPKGEINPNVMAAIKFLGVSEVYRVGGAQAIGAMAYGTKTIKKVDKIVGPGNIYVATAKKMVFGEVDIDMIAGPSEILIIADETAKPVFIAADLLSQAEHDELASSILITNSIKLAKAVSIEISKQIDKLERKHIVKKSLSSYGAIILADSIENSIELSNLIAPEHLEVMIEKPLNIIPNIKNAGAIFIGEWSPEALGDYSAGPNHTLPTCGTAKFSSSLGVYDFIKRSSFISFTKDGFKKIAKEVKIIAEAEGLDAHKNSISVRESL